MSNNKRLKSWLVDGGVQKGDTSEQPIADLFPKATVLFTDIAGFTAWSSSREPTQVFTLLQNIYRNFDEIADRRRVFKVETIAHRQGWPVGESGRFGHYVRQGVQGIRLLRIQGQPA